MPTPPTDLHSLAARAHALHVVYTRSFADDDIAGAEATMEEIDGLIARIDALADSPDAGEAIVDLCSAYLVDQRDTHERTNTDAISSRLLGDRDQAFVDLGLELALPEGRAHFDWLRAQDAESVALHPPARRPDDLDERIAAHVQGLTKAVATLGPEAWRVGRAGLATVRLMHDAADQISDLTEWLDASDHLVSLRRAARSVRRMKYFHLSEIQHGWLAARRAVARLAPS